MVIEARRRILDLVDEIRMFARGDTRSYNMLPHSVSEVVQRVIRFVSCDAKVRRTNVRYFCSEDSVVIMDADRIRQVLINLIQNAADALQNREGPQITIRVYIKGDHNCISVVDNGVGIPKMWFLTDRTKKRSHRKRYVIYCLISLCTSYVH